MIADHYMRLIDDMRDATDFETLVGIVTVAIAMAEHDEREACAKVADFGMLVPPDGGSPTEDEIAVAERIAAGIRARGEGK